MSNCLEDRLLILAPLGRDGELLQELAASHGMDGVVCTSAPEFAEQFSLGVGMAVLTEEALILQGKEAIFAAVDRQPAWSDVPWLVFVSKAGADSRLRKAVELMRPLRNVTVIERPVRPAVTLSVFEAGLRDRRRQYQVRDTIQALEQSQAALAASEERLRASQAAANVATWDWDLISDTLYWSDAYEALFGVQVDRPVDFGTWIKGAVRPDLLDYVHGEFLGASQQGALRVAFRVQADERWVEMGGKVVAAKDGKPSRMAGIALDITDRKRHEQELRNLNESLEHRVQERTESLLEKNQELEGFTYSISHDMRAPLRSMVAHAHMVMEDFGPHIPEEAQGHLKSLADAAKHMAQLVDDLLQYARLGKHEVRRMDFDLTELANTVVGSIVGQCEFEVQFSVEPGLTAHADRELVRMLLQNLAENACKYRREGTRIEVRAITIDEEPVLVVRDNGIGFDMKYAQRMFRPFERLHRQSEYPGTGIGLANVKRIVDRHGGKVWAEGRPGEGASFFFTLGDGALVRSAASLR